MKLDLKESTKYAVYASGDLIVLKPVSISKESDFKATMDQAQLDAKESGLTEEDIDVAIKKQDAKKRRALRVKIDSDDPTSRAKNGYGNMVIMSMRTYEEKMVMPDVYAKIAEEGKDIKEGRVHDGSEVLKKMREKYSV